MKFICNLPKFKQLLSEHYLCQSKQKERLNKITEIKNILENKDNRKILLIGPCSVDNYNAIIDYIQSLASIQEKVKQKILIIPRVYTSKPRTLGIGYKGMIHNSLNNKNNQDIFNGIVSVRKIHIDIINKTNMFCADQMLYPEIFYYYMDLPVYITVGARSVQNQYHRMLSSALDIPVGMKNPMNGNMQSLLNSIYAANQSQKIFFNGQQFLTKGNSLSHAILRGYQDNLNIMHPNYHFEELMLFMNLYSQSKLPNMSLIVDCNHCNSLKKYQQQIRIANQVMQNCIFEKDLNKFIKGLMIQSYLEDGNQKINGNVYGKSITDGCLGLKKTQELIFLLSDMIKI